LFGPIPKSNFSVYYIGLSDGNISGEFGLTPNSYCVPVNGIYYFLSCESAGKFEWPNGVNVLLKMNDLGNVTGCGLLLNPENKLSIFFTLNGILLGKSALVNCH
jgi:hypothetical protein